MGLNEALLNLQGDDKNVGRINIEWGTWWVKNIKKMENIPEGNIRTKGEIKISWGKNGWEKLSESW